MRTLEPIPAKLKQRMRQTRLYLSMSGSAGYALATGTLLLFHGARAFAHAGEGHVGLPWTFDPWILAPLVGAGVLYASGAGLLWRRAGRGRHIRGWQVLAYGAGWLCLMAALISPLHWLGEHVFAFHMIEHEIIMAVAAPLVVMARPAGALLWAFPHALRLGCGRFARRPAVRRIWRWLSEARTATLIHGVAIWVWHAPALFDAAVGDLLLHRLQHLTFVLTALLFWWSVLQRSDRGSGAWYLFVTMLHTSLLGALIALAPRVVYGVQTRYATEWGLSPLQDQQLAGVVMWVPAGTVYAGAALALIAIWIMRSSEGTGDVTRGS